jgi:hypothetical protein
MECYRSGIVLADGACGNRNPFDQLKSDYPPLEDYPRYARGARRIWKDMKLTIEFVRDFPCLDLA